MRCAGILRENAVDLVAKCFNKKSPEELKRFIREGLAICLQNGLTGVQTNDEKSVHVYSQLQSEGSLPLRVFLTPTYADIHREGQPQLAPKSLPALVNHGQDGVEDLGSPANLLSYDRVKIFSDGSLGAETAALRQPYNDTTQTGILLHSDEELTSQIEDAQLHGFRVEIHAIGDRAAEQVINAMIEARQRLAASNAGEHASRDAAQRPVLTHCQVLGDDLIEKMAEAGIIANVQPPFTPTDMRWVQQRISPAVQVNTHSSFVTGRWKTFTQHVTLFVFCCSAHLVLLENDA